MIIIEGVYNLWFLTSKITFSFQLDKIRFLRLQMLFKCFIDFPHYLLFYVPEKFGPHRTTTFKAGFVIFAVSYNLSLRFSDPQIFLYWKFSFQIHSVNPETKTRESHFCFNGPFQWSIFPSSPTSVLLLFFLSFRFPFSFI